MRTRLKKMPHCFGFAILLAKGIPAFCLAWTLLGSVAQASDGATSASDSASVERPSESSGERNFYQVLEDILADFEFDIKNGNVSGLKDLSIRNIVASESVPSSFKTHLELLVTERILKNSKTRVLQCLPCRSKKAKLDGETMTISATDTNPVELARLAKLTGIQNFMDIAYTYQSQGMVLSLTITDPESGAVIWSRSYNSETTRAAAARRGVDYNQIEQARNQVEYAPLVQYRLSVGLMFEPNVTGTTSCLMFGFRMMERYDNRKKEVGFEIDYILDASSIVHSSTSNAGNLWSGINFTLLFMHAWNFITEEENFHKTRGSLFAGAGGTYTSGYLGAVIRAGYEWRLGKHFALNGTLGYRPSSTAFVGSSSTTGTSVSGFEFGVNVGLLF